MSMSDGFMLQVTISKRTNGEVLEDLTITYPANTTIERAAAAIREQLERRFKVEDELRHLDDN